MRLRRLNAGTLRHRRTGSVRQPGGSLVAGPGLPALLATTLLSLIALPAATSSTSHSAVATTAAETKPSQAMPPLVTPVRGPSWLRHLGLAVDQTSMGEMGGHRPAPATARREPEIEGTSSARSKPLSSIMSRFLSLFRRDEQHAHGVLEEPFELTGADLYRLNCQSCHRPDGTGAPPEIKSLLGPVRGTSAVALEQRMKAIGRPIRTEMAAELAAQAEKTVRQRLRTGGKRMPAFAHLRGDEVDALMGYLGVLAGVPATPHATMLVTQSAARVGEHVVKGTCHICHDATGPGSGHMAMMQGTIPSLASMPREQSLASVVRQVEYGSSDMMTMMGGQRMPAMPYFTEDEIAAAYFYLANYPPES